MAVKTTFKGSDIYTIISPSGNTRASFVPAKGAVGSSIIMPFAGEGREILFLHDGFWEKENCFDLLGGFPFLFPVCGRLERLGHQGNYLYKEHIYNLPIHGFSAYFSWDILENHSSDSLVMELRENRDTLAIYPFKFTVQLKYTVHDGALICEQTYANTDTKPLPYYAGFHPYFLTPLSGEGKEQVTLDFKPSRLLRYNERMTDVIGEKKLFDLPASIADPAINEQLTEVETDNLVNLSYPDGFNLFMHTLGSKEINLFPYLQIYTMPDKPFICVEPWMGYPNALNTIYGCRVLHQGDSEKGRLELSVMTPKG